MLFDAKIILWATKSFTSHQIQNNIHHERLNEARIDGEGHPILEPTRADKLPYKEFSQKRAAYDQALPLFGTPKL